ncbi:MAG: oligosaccharide flippase family protein [Sedimentisphaerales bacterium]|nr:oligosaccharide flippase family protein [Sedimentisphaerales bacterium]
MEVKSNTLGILRGESLKAKSARGIVKLGTGTGIERVLRLVRTMILTRIIAVDQFGLMSIILVLVNIFEQLSEVGLKLSVIQSKRGSEYEYLNATWWLQAIRGLGLFAVAMAAAPFISSFYGKPHLLRLLQVSLLVIVFRGFISPRAHALQKEYKFGLVTLHLQGSALFGTIVTLVCAYYLRNIWALVIGYVAENLCLSILSYIIAPFKPRLGVDRDHLKELTAFVRGMIGLPSLSMIGYVAPTFVLGKLVSENSLGLYALAVQLVSIPLNFFNKVINPVILPGFAKKQDDRAALNKAVLNISKMVGIVMLPLVIYMMSCSSGLLYFLWGPQYVDATIPCVLLSLLIIVRTQGPVLSSVYMAVGQPHLQRRFVILMTSLIVIFIYPAIIHYGLIGAAATAVLSNYIAMFMQIFWCKRIIPLNFYDYIKCYIPGLLMAFAPVITVLLLVVSGVDSLAIIVISGGFALFMVYAVYFGRLFLSRQQKSIFPVAEKEKISLCDIA